MPRPLYVDAYFSSAGPRTASCSCHRKKRFDPLAECKVSLPPDHVCAVCPLPDSEALFEHVEREASFKARTRRLELEIGPQEDMRQVHPLLRHVVGNGAC